MVLVCSKLTGILVFRSLLSPGVDVDMAEQTSQECGVMITVPNCCPVELGKVWLDACQSKLNWTSVCEYTAHVC